MSTSVQITDDAHAVDAALPSVATVHGSTNRASRKSTQASKTAKPAREGLFIRMDSATKERAQYWAEKRGFTSVNAYVAEAVAEQIRRENYDFDVPDLLVARMNQIIDELKANSKNVANLELVVTKGLGSLIGLTRGDNYLLDDPNELA